MLSAEIVKMVENFDGWTFERNRLVPHECGSKISDIWEEYLGDGYSPMGDLNDHEVGLLYEVLKESQDPKIFETVKDFIVWCIRNFDWGVSGKECLMYHDAYDYFIKGEEIDPSHVFWKNWCESPKGKISFYEDYFSRRYVEDMFPHYVGSLRTLIMS